MGFEEGYGCPVTKKLDTRLSVLLLLVLTTGVLVATMSAPPAQACTPGSNGSNSHTQGGVEHGWTRTWSCDNWTYRGHTNHGHGDKYVSLQNFKTNDFKCSAYNPGPNNASCSFGPTTSIYIGSWNVAPSGGCAYSDGHGVCLHTMEPVS